MVRASEIHDLPPTIVSPAADQFTPVSRLLHWARYDGRRYVQMVVNRSKRSSRAGVRREMNRLLLQSMVELEQVLREDPDADVTWRREIVDP